MADREALIAAFLGLAGWDKAERRHLAGDASDRRYWRLIRGTDSAVLMDNPPGGADDPAAFAAMARHLSDLGLSPPRLIATHLTQGLLLLEDLGDGLFARLLAADPSREEPLYAAAVDVLVQLQAAPPPPGLPNLSAQDWAEAAAMALTVYAPAATRRPPDPGPVTRALALALQTHADGPRTLILRDYHAENLLWLPDRQGTARVGLLDFQLGQLGQPGYDLVSLLQDARRDVSPAIESRMIYRFAAAKGWDTEAFSAQYAALGAQRALRILGIFARLGLVAGKPGYLRLIPRVWRQLHQNLAHPALADLRAACLRDLPEPTPATLARIEAQCPTSPSR